MKLTAVPDPPFACALAGDPTLKCSPERARWSSGYWSDVCRNHMDRFRSFVNKRDRNPWTGRKKEVTS